MPHRLNEFRAKVQFVTFAKMPRLIRQAALSRGFVSNTQYIQHVLCDALARDLSLDVDDLKKQLPPPQGQAAHFHRKYDVKTKVRVSSGAVLIDQDVPDDFDPPNMSLDDKD